MIKISSFLMLIKESLFSYRKLKYFSFIILLFLCKLYSGNHIGGVMVSVLTLSVVDCVLACRSGQTKDYRISICCYSAKHATLTNKSKDK